MKITIDELDITGKCDLSALINEIKIWASLYEINFQFWPGNNNVYIYRDDVLFFDTGGFSTMEEVMEAACKYLRRINPSFARKNEVTKWL